MLGTENVGKLLLSLSIPSIIAQLVNILYNMVDRIYVGRLPEGTVAMSALSVALPIVTIILAFTQLLGIGGAPLAAIKLGKKDTDAAEKILTTSLVCLLMSGMLITIIVQIFAKDILYIFGADETNIAMAIEYIKIYTLGTIFVQISFGLNSYITTQGYARYSMSTVIIGAVLNIILDPIFIFLLNMGVKGAALATVLAQSVSAVWALRFFLSDRTSIRFRKKYLIPDIKVVGSICALGISPFIMNSTESILLISFNNQLSLYGGTMAVATMAILISIFQMISMTLQGICQGGQPIMSYNLGAGNKKRVRDTFKILYICCVSFTFVANGSILLFSNVFAGIFTTDPDTLRMATWAIRVYMAGGLFYGAQTACQMSFLALGQAKRSLSMALFRKIIVLIPLIYILPTLIGGSDFAIAMSAPVADLCYDGGKVFAVLISEAIADFSAAIVTSTMFFTFYRKHLKD